MEIWKDIEGYEGKYQVSSWGRVKSLNYRRTGKEKILKLDKCEDGYLRIKLLNNGKIYRFRVHRLVAKAFIPNPYNLPQVNHKDENPENNRVDNLEWCDPKYNSNYGTRNERCNKNHGKPKKVLCVETGIIYPSLMEAGRCIGVGHKSIIKCCQGKRKTTKGYHWQYAEND